MRKAEVTRNTNETKISVKLDLDGTGQIRIATGVPFLDHMLEQVARHGAFDVEVTAKASAARAASNGASSSGSPLPAWSR